MAAIRVLFLLWLIAGATAAVVASTDEAMDPPARAVVATLVTRTGETIQGEIVGANAKALMIKLDAPADSRRIQWAMLPAETTFRLWRQARGETTATRWIELATLLRGMHDGQELAESALSVAVLLDKELTEEADAVRQLPAPEAPQSVPSRSIGTALLDAMLPGEATAAGVTWGDFPAEREPEYIAAVKAHADDVAAKLVTGHPASARRGSMALRTTWSTRSSRRTARSSSRW